MSQRLRPSSRRSSSQIPATSCLPLHRNKEKNAFPIRWANSKSAASSCGAFSERKRSNARRPPWFGSNSATSPSISIALSSGNTMVPFTQRPSCLAALIMSARSQTEMAKSVMRRMDARIGRYSANVSVQRHYFVLFITEARYHGTWRIEIRRVQHDRSYTQRLTPFPKPHCTPLRNRLAQPSGLSYRFG